MAKYVLLLLTGIFLMSGFHSISGREVQMFRTETGTITIRPAAASGMCSSTEVASQPDSPKQAAVSEGYGSKTCEGVPGSVVRHRNMASSKTLKFNSPAVLLLLLSLLNSRLSDKKQKNFSSVFHPVRSSYRYYVYALGRMLI